MIMVNQKTFDKAVINNNMRAFWSDALFATSPEEREARAQKRYGEALAEFTTIMKSSKNKGDASYQVWAINKALGLSYKAHTGRIR
jgi:hypothetical protein